ncbi:MAG: glycosyltransferase family 4 protein [Verrucomicrobiota bacterium]|nr:glycosyltransferase family 4 protein [Verrucomicrobiota bacterium]
MTAIHQFVAGFANGDAITNESRALRALFHSWGCESDIFSETRRILPELRREARDVANYPAAARPDDVLLLHLSIGSTVNDVFSALPGRKAILYHNITPPGYFRLVQPETDRALAHGRDQLRQLAGVASVNLAVSPFNAREMIALGYRDVRVFPLFIEFGRLAEPPDRKILREFDDDLVNVLFVGRCAPNKKIEDAIEAFRCFHRFVEPRSRFVHVGSFVGTERYQHLLAAQARESGVRQIHFAGTVTQPALNAFYRSARVFLCMSEHEGFCIPILEAMASGVPVMAYAAAAVPDTMDGAGILFREKNYELIAEMMGRVARDAAFRAAVVEGQNERVRRYRARDLAAELRQHLAPILRGN